MPIERAGSDVSVTLNTASNTFAITVGNETIQASPKQLGALIEAELSSLAQHLDALPKAEKEPFRRGEPVSALRATDMIANSDLGAQNFVTEMHVGPVVLRFAGPREMVVDYCHQVMMQIQREDTGQQRPS